MYVNLTLTLALSGSRYELKTTDSRILDYSSGEIMIGKVKLGRFIEFCLVRLSKVR